MKRWLVLSIVVGLLLLALVPVVSAWTPVTGCTFAGTSTEPLGPWAWGGTVTARQTGTGIVVGSGTLDANGCFEFPIGNGPALTVTIDFTPGPDGDPADQTCSVPTDTDYLPLPYACGPIYTGTGPNAVTVAGFAADAVGATVWVPLGLLGIVLGFVSLRLAFRSARG